MDLTKNTDLDKYKYTGYSIGYDPCSEFVFKDWKCGKNVSIFGADLSSSVDVDNKEKDILIFVEGSTQGLDNTILTAEAKYLISFTKSRRKNYIKSTLLYIYFFIHVYFSKTIKQYIN